MTKRPESISEKMKRLISKFPHTYALTNDSKSKTISYETNELPPLVIKTGKVSRKIDVTLLSAEADDQALLRILLTNTRNRS